MNKKGFLKKKEMYKTHHISLCGIFVCRSFAKWHFGRRKKERKRKAHLLLKWSLSFDLFSRHRSHVKLLVSFKVINFFEYWGKRIFNRRPEVFMCLIIRFKCWVFIFSPPFKKKEGKGGEKRNGILSFC